MRVPLPSLLSAELDNFNSSDFLFLDAFFLDSVWAVTKEICSPELPSRDGGAPGTDTARDTRSGSRAGSAAPRHPRFLLKEQRVSTWGKGVIYPGGFLKAGQGSWMRRALLGQSTAHCRGSGFNLRLNVPFSIPDALQTPQPILGEQDGLIEASPTQGMADPIRHPDPTMETSGLTNLWVKQIFTFNFT